MEEQRNQKPDSAITYHNKDVISKIFGETLKNKSFEVYGIEIPEIIEVLPTNLPAVEANEMRLDNLFRLKDDSLALVDYESTYDYEDKIKYLNYIVRTIKRYKVFKNTNQILRMIVIYTGDVEKGKTRDKLDVGCLQLKVEEVFFSELNAEVIEENLYQKIHAGEALSEQEQMQFVILPLIYKGVEEKQKCIRRCFEMGKMIERAELQTFVLTGLLVFTDKVIRREDSEKIRRWIEMTKVGQILEEEKQQAIEKAIKKTSRETARKMLDCGFTMDQILQCIDGLTRGELEMMK